MREFLIGAKGNRIKLVIVVEGNRLKLYSEFLSLIMRYKD